MPVWQERGGTVLDREVLIRLEHLERRQHNLANALQDMTSEARANQLEIAYLLRVHRSDEIKQAVSWQARARAWLRR